MGENQKAIYYLATDSLKSAKSAPFLEKLLQKDIEVCAGCRFGFIIS
jgi:heat shock protein beta